EVRDHDAIVINPGAWTHYSWAIRDALAACDVPVVEVHISDVNAREEFRRVNVLVGVVAHSVVGKGWQGYLEAIDWLAAQAG
ncbi:MAG: 3-dehydroquinate dehydratase, partial [Actinomycetes bacterium]|nr:3-dehydroquinate dehydratase [Actinomycetes bacterium]MDX5381151.1 3-dehydroquinate dehydratase [Actinomycetes bacterium]MDX5400411.1 3-dehydroquinate dehydratase [Actinomycetes bacterium]MDX5450912.1 3-dehydroquinate dehydratase [Actinomycetes bacterium]